MGIRYILLSSYTVTLHLFSETHTTNVIDLQLTWTTGSAQVTASILLTRHNPESCEFLRNSQYTSQLSISVDYLVG